MAQVVLGLMTPGMYKRGWDPIFNAMPLSPQTLFPVDTLVLTAMCLNETKLSYQGPYKMFTPYALRATETKAPNT